MSCFASWLKEYNFAYFIGKLRFPWESTDAYWKYAAKKVHIYYFFFSAKVQEKQNRKLGKFCSTIGLEM